MTINGPAATGGEDRSRGPADPKVAAQASQPPDALTPEALSVLRLEVRMLAVALEARPPCDGC